MRISLLLSAMALLIIAMTSLTGCAGQFYAGANYGNVEINNADGSTEKWNIVGAKDETNIDFSITRPDGSKVRYKAEQSNSSAVLGKLVEQSTAVIGLAQKVVEKAPLP